MSIHALQVTVPCAKRERERERERERSLQGTGSRGCGGCRIPRSEVRELEPQEGCCFKDSGQEKTTPPSHRSQAGKVSSYSAFVVYSHIQLTK